ncbi:[citrate (pro-3S)-lyase] ligase [Orbaceae bacterium ESL0721]|nr:[citrate (pro-3S)-lyase] ligase [Orbaceae bacterium ESL0721]
MSDFAELSGIDYLVVNINAVNSDNALHDREQIVQLLKLSDLNLDPNVTYFIVAKKGDSVIGCAGLDHNIIKCVAIHPDYQGNQLNLILMDKTIKYAQDRGYFHLFLYTKPENEPIFRGCGFYPIVTIKGVVVLMENSPVGIKQYCKQLTLQRKSGSKIGAIVMNANPFTKGHQYLVDYAAKQCDWLHLFVVNEDASRFSFADRFKLVKEGTAGVANITVHPSSEYIISKATFPTYFLKERAKIDQAYMGVDLLIFRNYIAPALQITHRFVGTEPYSEVTHAYNEAMRYWLQDAGVSSAPAVRLVEIERIKEGDNIISASLVRNLLDAKQYDRVKTLVPSTTWNYLAKHLN